MALAFAGCSSGGNTKTQTTPTITWATPAAITQGTALSSTQLDASSGGVAGTFVYTPAAGTVLPAGTQTLSVTFTPSDTADYTSATASVSLVVNATNKTTPTITWATPAAITYGTALSSTQLDASASTSAGNVAGTFTYTPAAGAIVPAGSQTLSVSFTPTDTADYNSASGSVTLTVNKATPAVTWATPAAIPYGTVLSPTQLDASAGGVTGTFTYTPASGATLTAGSHTLSVIFTPTDTIDYTSAPASTTLTVNKATPVITWSPAVLLVNSDLGAAQLNANAGSVAGSFAYNPPSGTPETSVGSVTLNATFTPTDTVDYTTASSTATLAVVSSTYTAVVDFGSSKQTIRGFGGSTAWMPELSQTQMNTLFGTGKDQLGLSILRVRIDPSSTTGGAANWGTELANAKAAQAAGSDVIVFATPWTAPAAWKTYSASVPYNASCSSSSSSLCGGYLNPLAYADYAGYLESFVDYFANNNVNLYAISMQNEPDENVAYESCVWSGAQMDTWVASLTANGATNPLTTKLIMPESFQFNTALSDPSLQDANAVNNISIIAGHLYGSAPFYYTNAFNKVKEVWMTEHYLTPTGAQPGIADALAAAKEVNDSMSIGDYSAYVWWWIVDWNPGSGMTNTGLADQNGNPTYYGYALGQYSQFVRPGYVRSNATSNPQGSVYVTAYNGDGHYVIVAINMGTTAESQQFVIQNQTVTSLTPYQTTASGGLTPLTPITVTGDIFTYSLPAQSITTFVE